MDSNEGHFWLAITRVWGNGALPTARSKGQWTQNITAIPSGFLAQFSDNFAVPESVRLIKCHPPEPSTVRSWVLHGETDAAEYIITTGLPD
jgi:hypothetical protein